MRYILALSLLLSACASYEVLPSGRRLKTNDEYVEVIEKNSNHVRRYNGFYNTIDVQGTLLNSEMLDAQIDQNARLYQWTEARMNEERSKNIERMSKQTEVFVSFFTPEKKDDNLAKFDTKWQIYLDVNGQRYDGKVTRIKQLVSETQSVYPYYVRFATPYVLTFSTPMSGIEGKPMKVIITGPVDSAVLNFNSVSK
ncbi:hypothetical protein D3C87_175050 [compost metagenome]